MIGKLLSNPRAVGALALIAVVLVVRSAAPNLFSPASAAEEPVQASGKSIPVKAEDAAPPIEFEKLQWAVELSRDPFRPARVLLPVAAIAEDSNTQNRLKLSAIWIQNSGRWAILNDQLVEEGESVLEYQIEAIRPDRVIVVGPGGRESVPFRSTQIARDSAAAAAASGASPTRKP